MKKDNWINFIASQTLPRRVGDAERLSGGNIRSIAPWSPRLHADIYSCQTARWGTIVTGGEMFAAPTRYDVTVCGPYRLDQLAAACAAGPAIWPQLDGCRVHRGVPSRKYDASNTAGNINLASLRAGRSGKTARSCPAVAWFVRYTWPHKTAATSAKLVGDNERERSAACDAVGINTFRAWWHFGGHFH